LRVGKGGDAPSARLTSAANDWLERYDEIEAVAR
jgi:hypothetical protein